LNTSQFQSIEVFLNDHISLISHLVDTCKLNRVNYQHLMGLLLYPDNFEQESVD